MLACLDGVYLLKQRHSSQFDTERSLPGVVFAACAVSFARSGHAITRIVFITNRCSCPLKGRLER